MQKPEALTLVGAGPVGALLATLLARRGFGVRIYERRPDMRKQKLSAGRSINLALSVRGLHALGLVGLEQEVLRLSVPMRGRMIHAPDGALSFQRYGKDDSECIHSVSRGGLNQLLMSSAEATGRVAIEFGQRVVATDVEAGTLRVQGDGSEAREVPAPVVIGTDGSASVIREAVMAAAKDQAQCSEELLGHGYKELTLPAAPGGGFALEKNALHIWPRGDYMLIALPNLDGSFTCTLFLPLKGALSFETLTTAAGVRELFRSSFGDIASLIPDLERSFFENPTGHMLTVKCAPWHAAGRALLLGDAAHAIVPFFGQGMNCGFEDCAILDGLLAGPGRDWAEVFESISAARKTNADAIADMAVENFAEMSSKVASPRFLMEKAVERLLQARFPGRYFSRYSLVTFSREPYRLAYEMGLAQAGILSELCQGIESENQVDLQAAEKLIESRLTPFLDRMARPSKGNPSHGS